ncbi:MAG: tetratricopeptide repeat protein [Bacteroidetes bacterium]|nr:tetratricopeptide repeat protein [Bacteroidota bacterium]
MRATPIFLLLCLFFRGPIAGFPQHSLSKKELKAQELAANTSRFFIEGEKALVLGDLEKAYRYLEKASEFSPEEPAISYKLAEVLLKNSQAEKALPYALKAAAGDPDNLFYVLMVAELYSNLKQPLQAAALLEKLTTASTKNQQYNLELASIYLNANEFDKALVALDRAEDFYGVREAFTAQKQRIYLRKDQLGKAIEEGEKLIISFPGNPNYVLLLVEILYNNAKLDQAIQLVNTEITKYPNQPELQLAAHTLYQHKGQISEANSFLLEAIASPDLAPSSKAAAFQGLLQEMKTEEREKLLDKLELLLKEVYPEDAAIFEAIGNRRKAENKLEEALAMYKKSIAIQPKNEKLLEEVIVNSFDEGGNYEEVARYTSVALEEYPESAEFWFYEGVILSAQKKDSSAIQALETALTLNTEKNPQLAQVAYSTLGNSLYQLGDQAAAFINFDKALALNPTDEQVLNNYAYFLALGKQELEKALDMAQRVVRKNPKNATYLDTLAWVLYQLKRYSEAALYLEEAIKIEKEPSGVLMEHFGDVLFRLGKAEEAVGWWKKAKESPEGSDSLAQKIKDQQIHD